MSCSPSHMPVTWLCDAACGRKVKQNILSAQYFVQNRHIKNTSEQKYARRDSAIDAGGGLLRNHAGRSGKISLTLRARWIARNFSENFIDFEVTLGGEIKRAKLKKVENLEMSTVGH